MFRHSSSFTSRSWEQAFFFGPDWTKAFVNNDAKGSVLKVLLRFASDPFCRKVGFLALLFVAFSYLMKANFTRLMQGLDWCILRGAAVGWNVVWAEQLRFACTPQNLVKLALLFLSILSFFVMPQMLLSLALAWPLIRLMFAHDIRRARKMGFLLYTIAYCGTQTAGYNPTSLEPLVILMLCEVFPNDLGTRRYGSYQPFIVAIFIASSLLWKLQGKITDYGYAWWGLKATGILSSDHNLPSKLLAGMTSDAQTAAMINAAVEAGEGLSQNDTVFAYPSIPIIYTLLSRPAPTNGVLWFDAASEKDGERAVAALKAKLPEVIFWLRPPAYVYEGHFALRGKKAAVNYVDSWLLEEMRNGKYSIEKAILSYSSQILEADAGEAFSGSINLEFSPDQKHKFEKHSKKAKYFEKNWQLSDDIIDLKFHNSAVLRNFLETTPLLIDMNEFVFYVIRRTKAD